MNIKPCPFCGSNIITQCSSFDDVENTEDHYIRCADCCCSSAWYANMDAAITAWNKRECDKEIAMLKEEIKNGEYEMSEI